MDQPVNARFSHLQSKTEISKPHQLKILHITQHKIFVSSAKHVDTMEKREKTR